jgi:hypothetical protein
MEEQEATFAANYDRPEALRPEDQQTLITNELSKVMSSISDALHSRAQPYDPSKADFSALPKFAPLFAAPQSSIASLFQEPINDRLSNVSSTMPVRPVANLKLALSAFAVPTAFELEVRPTDHAAEFNALLARAIGRDRHTTVINFGNPNALASIVLLAELLLAGTRSTPIGLVANLLAELETAVQSGLVLSNLLVAVLTAKGTIKEVAPLKYTARFVYALLKDGQLSALFAFLARSDVFVPGNYYADSPLRRSDLCEQLSVAIQQIEMGELQGELNLQSIAALPKPITGSVFAWRVECEVHQYVSKVQGWLFENAAVGNLHLTHLAAVVKLAVRGILMQASGEVAPMEALWDIFEAAGSASVAHESFPEFKRLLAEKDVASALTRSFRKAVTMLYLMLVNGLLPYLPVYVIGLKPPRKCPDPMYWKDEAACLRLGCALLPLKNIGVEVDQAAFRAQFEDD